MSSQLKILDTSLTELATLEVAKSATRMEKINADNTLNFSVLVKQSASAYLNENRIIGLAGDYFDIASFKKEQLSNGTLLVTVECEHISYRLNNSEYDLDYFTEMGTPVTILGKILAGTGFTVGVVEFTSIVTYSAQEKRSRRGLLMEFVAYLGGEVDFHGFEVSILQHRGSSTPQALLVGQHINVISKTVNKRQFDSNGYPKVSYSCDVLKPMALALGDEVTLDYDALDINVTLRIVSMTYDPYNPRTMAIEIGNYVNSLEDSLYRIQTSTVSKDKIYNGCRIGPEFGFEAVLSDNTARAFFNSTAIKMQKGDGTGNNWTDVLFFDPVEQTYKFVGSIVIEDGTITWAKMASDVITGVTTISEDAISTATIKVNQLTSLGTDPIIKLFTGLTVENSGDPALDATYNMNTGIGDKIRLKWNNSNYIAVGENLIEFYFYDPLLGGTTARAQIKPDGFYFDGVRLNPATLSGSSGHIETGSATYSGTESTTLTILYGATFSEEPTVTSSLVILPANVALGCGAEASDGTNPNYAFDGILSEANAWVSSTAAYHWIMVYLRGVVVVNKARLYSGIADGTKIVTDGLLQYHDGSTWVDVPGGTISGNQNGVLEIAFAPVTVTGAMMRLWINTPGEVYVQELQLIESFSEHVDLAIAHKTAMDGTYAGVDVVVTRELSTDAAFKVSIMAVGS